MLIGGLIAGAVALGAALLSDGSVDPKNKETPNSQQPHQIS